MRKSLSKLPVTLMGILMYRFLPIRKQIVIDNIERVFNDNATAKEKERLVKSFYSHLVLLLKEWFFLGWLSSDKIKRQVEIRGVEHLLNAANQERGVLILTGHLGSWELTGPVAFHSIHQLKDRFYIIRRPIRNKWIEKMVFKRFDQWGINRINSIDAPKKVSQALKNKKIVVFLFDQHACIKQNSGIAVDFFGIKAGTYRSLALFSSKYQTPVVPLSGYRDHKGKHVVEFHPALNWEGHQDKEKAIYNNTLRYNQTLEKMILEHPEQWWWVHRRWKL